MHNTAKFSSNAINPQIWVEKYRDLLFRYAIARLRDVDLAEEKIQETYLAALKSRKNFQGLASEKTWLISILKRKIYDHFRRINRDRQFNVIFHTESMCYDVFDNKRIPQLCQFYGYKSNIPTKLGWSQPFICWRYNRLQSC